MELPDRVRRNRLRIRRGHADRDRLRYLRRDTTSDEFRRENPEVHVIWHGPDPILLDQADEQGCRRVEVAGVSGVPGFTQSRYGTKGNFEVVVPLQSGGLAHFFRDNDDAALRWHQAPRFGASGTPIDAVSLIASNFGNPGNFELVARAGDRLLFFWRDNAGWHGPYPLVADGHEVRGVSGNPALIQGRFGTKGNFELIVPLAAGGIAHFFRENDLGGLPWRRAPTFARIGRVDAVTLVESTFGSPGNLEVIVLAGGRLGHFWRESTGTLNWHGPFWLRTA